MEEEGAVDEWEEDAVDIGVSDSEEGWRCSGNLT